MASKSFNWLIYGIDPETHEDELVYKFFSEQMSEQETHRVAQQLRDDGYSNVRVIKSEE